MGARRVGWFVAVVLASARCVAPSAPDASLPERVDSGFEGAADAGPDGGVDASVPSCATLACPPWQRCVEGAAGASCVGAVTLSWVFPAAGASTPIDVDSVPLAIHTTADETVDVPWTSSALSMSAGTFSGQPGFRGSTLFLADVDAGELVLTAGWDGGPSATTTLLLTAPRVRLPPVPSFGTNQPDFDPNDPAGNAFRRDDVVGVELDELQPPLVLLAKLDTPTARTSTFPVTERCDAGSCWRVDLHLAELDFPAFRGRVLVWASRPDGGTTTRPRAIPVTRWRWRRQVSGVPNPLSVTRPIASEVPGAQGILVGSADTASSGRLLLLSGNGRLLTISDPVLAQNTRAVHTLAASSSSLAVGLVGTAGARLHLLNTPDIDLDAGVPVACGAAGDHLNPARFFVTTNSRRMTVATSTSSTTVDVCEFSGATPSRIVASTSSLSFVPNSLACITSVLPTNLVRPTARAYTLAFAVMNVDFLGASYSVFAGGADGGIWWLTGTGTPGFPEAERGVWDGGVVDAMALSHATGPITRLFWVDSSRVVRWGEPTLDGIAQASAKAVLPARVETTPVIVAVADQPNRNSIAFVMPDGRVVVLSIPTLGLRWSLPPGSLGVQGPVTSEPIYVDSCERLGSLLVASGNGSLFSFIGDLPAVTPYDLWPMGGRTQSNQHTGGTPFCVPD